MRQLPLVLLCAASTLACGPGFGVGRNTFIGRMEEDETGEGEASESSDTDASSGDGDGDDPATASGDGDGEATSASGDGDGEATTASGDGDGDAPTSSGDGDGEPAPCMRNRYSYQVNTASWEVLPLDSLWTGPNAPPCDVGLTSAINVEVWGQLLVWADDGMYYRRINGTWQAPEPTSDRWGVIANADIGASSYIAPNGDNTWATVIFSTAGMAYSYELYEDGGTVYVQSLPLEDGPEPAPPSASLTAKWAATWCKLDMWPNLSWLSSYLGFDNGTLYQNVGFNSWSNWPNANSPLFGAPPPGFDPGAMEAGWGGTQPDRVYWVGL